MRRCSSVWARSRRAAKTMGVRCGMCLCPARPATFARMAQGGSGWPDEGQRPDQSMVFGRAKLQAVSGMKHGQTPNRFSRRCAPPTPDATGAARTRGAAQRAVPGRRRLGGGVTPGAFLEASSPPCLPPCPSPAPWAMPMPTNASTSCGRSASAAPFRRPPRPRAGGGGVGGGGVGGGGGGGGGLTAAGRELLAAADALALARGAVLARWQAAPDAGPALARLALRTRMRNQVPCTVGPLALQGQNVRGPLRLGRPGGAGGAGGGGGGDVGGGVGGESAEFLGLQPGLAVQALGKATAVRVERAGAALAAEPGILRLPAKAVRVVRGSSGDEVSAELAAGLQLVGFAMPGSGLRAGHRVVLVLEENAVVLALAHG